MNGSFFLLPKSKRWLYTLVSASLAGGIVTALLGTQPQTTAQTPDLLIPSNLQIAIDPTHRIAQDPNLLQTIKASLEQVPNAFRNRRMWWEWGRLDGIPVALRVNSNSAKPGLKADIGGPRKSQDFLGQGALPLMAYAVVTSEGLGIFVQNTSTQPINLRLSTPLSAGIYRIERLSTIIPPQVALRTIAEQNPPGLELHWLQGVILKRAGIVEKRDRLASGELAIYRFTDERSALRQALSDAFEGLHQFAKQRPSAANRLRHILYEGSADYHRLLNASDSEECIQSLRAASLIVGQAQSLCRNYRIDNVIPAGLGETLEDALGRVADSISVIGTVLLGIAPDMTVLPPLDQNPMNQSQVYQVQLALSNGGLHTISLVKLGMLLDKMSANFQCNPADAAVFPNLAPGQAVVANFTLHALPMASTPPSDYPAEVIYTAGGGPIRVTLGLNTE
jgi:hypothetical protein